VFQPWMQQRKLAYVIHKHVISGILRACTWIIRKVFTAIDLNEDGLLHSNQTRIQSFARESEC
ncbi:hypothetical protein FRX31_014608, partial [Thalictrum thalictroides]